MFPDFQSTGPRSFSSSKQLLIPLADFVQDQIPDIHEIEPFGPEGNVVFINLRTADFQDAGNVP
jgi:hypothetical protein